MTAHKQKPTITPERVQWFADYYRKHGAWGAFHVTLDDCNWTLGTDVQYSQGEPGEEEAIAWFNMLTPSQRRRLGQKVQDLANTVDRSPRVKPVTVVVTAIDQESGTVTVEAVASRR